MQKMYLVSAKERPKPRGKKIRAKPARERTKPRRKKTRTKRPSTHHATNPYDIEMLRTQHGMHRALQDRTQPLRSRIKRHHQELRRFLTLKGQREQKPYGMMQSVAEEDGDDAHFLVGIPREQRARAQRVLEKLREADVLTWDKSASVYYQGELIPRSNISRLIREMVVKEGQSKRKPLGWATFLDALAESDVIFPPRQSEVEFARGWLPYEDEDDEEQQALRTIMEREVDRLSLPGTSQKRK